MFPLFLTLALALSPGNPPDGSLEPKPLTSSAKQVTAPVTGQPLPLTFTEFFEATPSELKLSPHLVSLKGKRVRIVGYMAHMEEPLKGAFYLCPAPVVCDESGAGIGDLPVNVVRVLSASARNRSIPYQKGRIIVTGTLDVGNRSEEDGTISTVRILLDPTPGKSLSGKTVSPSKQKKEKGTKSHSSAASHQRRAN